MSPGRACDGRTWLECRGSTVRWASESGLTIWGLPVVVDRRVKPGEYRFRLEEEVEIVEVWRER